MQVFDEVPGLVGNAVGRGSRRAGSGFTLGTMNQMNPRKWLTREVSDHLAMGPVGVYELLWLLKGSSYVLTEGEAIELAVQVVRNILADGAVSLYVLRWPGGQVVDGPLPPSSMTTDAALWGELPAKTFLALIAAEAADDAL